jgi:hypothetical protein
VIEGIPRLRPPLSQLRQTINSLDAVKEDEWDKIVSTKASWDPEISNILLVIEVINHLRYSVQGKSLTKGEVVSGIAILPDLSR